MADKLPSTCAQGSFDNDSDRPAKTVTGTHQVDKQEATLALLEQAIKNLDKGKAKCANQICFV